MLVDFATTFSHTPGPPDEPARPGAGESLVVTKTHVVAEKRWPQLVARIHREPARVGPVLVPPKPHTELVVQLAGGLRFDVTRAGNRRRYATAPGSVFLTAAHKPAYEVEWLNESPEPVRTLHLYFDNELLARTMAESGLDSTNLEVRSGSCLQDPLLQQLGLALARELTDSASLSDLYTDSLVQLLAAQLVRHHCTSPHALPTPRGPLPPARLRQLTEYVQAHLSQPVSLAELAAVACLSPYHFCRVFKRTTGQSPNQYVISQRMEKARQLLRSGELSVSQVAYEVGYFNPSHFAQLFLRHTGYLPAKYPKVGFACAG